MTRLSTQGVRPAIFLLCLSLTAPAALADRLLGTIGRGGTLSTLVELDPATGAVSRTIGPVGYAVNGLEYDATTGKLYATTSHKDPSFPVGLIEVDMATGAGTPIGSMPPLDDAIVTLTSDASGQLYGWIEPYEDDLAKIDKKTGDAVKVGESGLGTGGHGLAFDNHDRLFLVQYMIEKIDPVSGRSASVGSVDVDAHHGDFGPSNLYWGLEQGGLYLHVIDIDAQKVVNTLPTAADLHTLTWVTGASGCVLNVAAIFEEDVLKIDLTVGPTEPAQWYVSLFLLGTHIPIVENLALPALVPALDVPVALPLPPGLGNVAVSTYLWTATDGVICSDMAVGMTSRVVPAVLAPMDR